MSDIRIASVSTASNAHSAEPVPLRLDDALASAEQHVQAGRLPAAEALCSEILRARPDCAPALNLLGIAAHQRGQPPSAIDFMQRAIAADTTVALYHGNLGEMYRLAGRPQDAIAAARRAIELRPDYPEALSNLGVALYEVRSFRKPPTPTARPSRPSPILPKRTAISAMRCTHCESSMTRSTPTVAPSHCDPTLPMPGPISARRCIIADVSTTAPRRCAAPSRSRRIMPMRIPDLACCS
jgi:hypothetical protein